MISNHWYVLVKSLVELHESYFQQIHHSFERDFQLILKYVPIVLLVFLEKHNKVLEYID